MKINLYLIRHALSEINENKICLKIDPNITERGMKQCKELKEFLQKEFKTFQNCKNMYFLRQTKALQESKGPCTEENMTVELPGQVLGSHGAPGDPKSAFWGPRGV